MGGPRPQFTGMSAFFALSDDFFMRQMYNLLFYKLIIIGMPLALTSIGPDSKKKYGMLNVQTVTPESI